MKKKVILILLLAILLFAAFLRLYRIADYMTFLGDEGRDVTIARDILMGHFTLLGPRSSAGNFFYGPIYYYMIAPFLWIFRYDPVGPAVMVALFSVATDYLIFFVGKKFFNEIAGLAAAALYAVSPLVIIYSHSSWNPDVLPFFAILIIYFLYKSVEENHRARYIFLTGLFLGIGLQLHYLAVFLGVISVAYIGIVNVKLYGKTKLWELFLSYVRFGCGFLIGFSPFLGFEIRHGFPNSKAIIAFIFSDTLHKTYTTHTTYINTVSNVFFRTFARLVFDFPTPDRYSLYSHTTLFTWGAVIMLISILAIISVYMIKDKFAVLILYLWLFGSVCMFGLYKSSIYDYLFTFLFPLPFLIIGNLITTIYDWCAGKKHIIIGIVVSSVLFLSIFIFNVADWQFRFVPNKQKLQTETIASFVISKTGGKPYNFALLSLGNSDYAYRYYLNYLGDPPVVINNPIDDPKRTSVTSQLLIVCEDLGCKPLGNSFFDVAAFGQAQITNEWYVSVVKVIRLIHYTGPKKNRS